MERPGWQHEIQPSGTRGFASQQERNQRFLPARAGRPTCLLLGLPRAAAPLASIFCVDPAGGPTGGAPCTNANALTTIQAAVNAAATSGDEIRVAAGTYTGAGTAVVAIAKSLTLTGGFPGGGAGGWNTPGSHTLTVIDGQNAREGIDYNSNTTMTVQNLTVVNGGIILDLGATVTNDLPMVTRALTQTAGIIQGTAPFTITNAFVWSAGTHSGSSHTDLLSGGQFTISGSVQIESGRNVNNLGAATWSGGNTLGGTGGTFNNQSGATFVATSSSA